MGASSCPSSGGTVENGPAGAEDAGTNDKNRRMSHVQDEMGKLMHHHEQELLSVWEGSHLDDNKGGWLDPERCAKARREAVEYIRRHKLHTSVPRKVCLRETGRHQSRQDGRRLTRVN